MKRLFAFLLACVLLCACSACKKESPPAPEPAQTTKADPEQMISGLSVRIPVTQYRLGRTEPELLDLGEHLLPYDKGAVLTGMIFAQDEAENDTEAAAFYAPDRSCVVQTLAVSPDGRVVQAALDGERLFSLEAAGEDGTQWALHGPDMEASLDAALTGCSNITAMAVREDTVYLAADGACVLACSLDGMLLWKQEAPAIDRFFSAQDGRLLAWARQEQALYLLSQQDAEPADALSESMTMESIDGIGSRQYVARSGRGNSIGSRARNFIDRIRGSISSVRIVRG